MRGLGAPAAVLAVAFAAMAAVGPLHEHARAFVGLFGVAAAAYGAAVAGVLRRPPPGRAAVVGILAAGLAFRLLLWPTAPTLSTDVYRYLWDGALAVAGVSPYRHPPTAPELAAFRDAVVFPQLNHADWHTIYPPGAQLLFAAAARAAPRSVLAWKALMLAFEAGAAAALLGWLRALGRPAAWVLVYAWHPLAVVEIAGSGHLDAVTLALTVLALWLARCGRAGWAGAVVGLGTLVKLHPALLLAAVAPGRPARAALAAAGVVAAGYALYWTEGAAALGSLPRYVADEEFNGTLRVALEPLLAPLGPDGRVAARLLPLGMLAALAGWVGWGGGRVWPVPRRALVLIGAYLVTTPSLFPWYALWLVPVLAVRPAWPWLWLSLAVALAYLVFGEPVWRIPPWARLAEFAPLGAGLGLAAWRAVAARRALARARAGGGPGAVPVVSHQRPAGAPSPWLDALGAGGGAPPGPPRGDQ